MAIYLKPDKSYVWNNVPINQYFITEHNVNKIAMPSKRSKKLLGITIHNTDWINVNSATTPAEQYTRACINGNLNSVRVHYYVDNTCAWWNLPDEWQGWHAADGSGNGNTATISIECIMRNSYDAESLKSMDNCARLTAWLLKKYNFTTNDVYTHTYWLHMRDKDTISKTGTKDEICTARHPYKLCPLYIVPQWDEFLALVNKYLKELGGKVETIETKPITPVTSKDTLPYLVKIIDRSGMNVRSGAGVNNPIVTTVKYGEVYTVVAEVKVGGSTWGRLKSGAGYINVGDKYVTKVK